MSNGISFKALIFPLVFLSCCFLFTSCSKTDDDSSDKTTFGIFKVINDTTIEMDGEITSATLDDFNELIESYPNVNKINMIEVPGSSDDEVNLEVSRKVHEKNIAIHLVDDGLIASGGVDFFLAGTTRTKGTNTQIGVHSWSDGEQDATDFAEGHANHLPYINYYVSIGFSQTDAESFYYFTINAASADSIHWMTESEIAQYKILS